MSGGVFASHLERILIELCRDSDARSPDASDMRRRFETLQSYGRLPAGREHRSTRLNSMHVAYALLGLTPVLPGWAGHTATVLARFLPVGGPAASIEGAESLVDAIALLIDSREARSRLVSLSLSMAEAGFNSNGKAELIVVEGEAVRHIGFVSQLAVSALMPGAEKRTDAAPRFNGAARAFLLNRAFFEELARRLEEASRWPEPAGDGSEYDADDARKARLKALGARPGSRFLNMGVDTQATWPKEERLVRFDKYDLVLMPKTKEHGTSVHIDLHANRLSDRDALTVINRFLSVCAWCSDQFAILQDGWSGNPVPVPVQRRDLAFATAFHWIFDRKVPATDETCRALAHYREALNAEEASLVSYAVLSYFKVLEIRLRNFTEIGPWIAANLPMALPPDPNDRTFAMFEADRGTASPEGYLWSSCRKATAHASISRPSDADLAEEVTRLRVAARVMRRLARHFIAEELGVSEKMYSGT